MVCAPIRSIIPSLKLGDYLSMLYLTCTTISSVDLAHYGVSRAKDWVSVDSDTSTCIWFYTSTDNNDGGMTCYLTFFSTLFQSYQDDGRVIMKGYVQ